MEAQSPALSLDHDPNILQLLNDPQNPNQTLNSDSEYAEELQLQEAIMASYISLQTPQIISAQDHQNPSTEVGESSQNSSIEVGSQNSSTEVGESSQNSSTEVGESSQNSSTEVGESSQNYCEICAERKENGQMFPLENCSHKFCTECISKHISIKIKKRRITIQETSPVFTCPGLDCKAELTIDNCRQILPEDVITTWEDVLCESLIPESQMFYCPYKDCSGLLINDGDGEVVREAECPYCKRLFCAECNVVWHCGVNCEEFSKLSENERGSEDLMVHQLAKEKKWQRCPKCRFFVERNEGCLHMSCRCGFQFCYGCGATWSSSHGGCQ